MKDQWASKILAGVITLGVGIMCVWTVRTVQQHELAVQAQGIQIKAIEASIVEVNRQIQETLKDIKSDLKDLKREARRRNPNFETEDNQ